MYRIVFIGLVVGGLAFGNEKCSENVGRYSGPWPASGVGDQRGLGQDDIGLRGTRVHGNADDEIDRGSSTSSNSSETRGFEGGGRSVEF